MNTHTIEEFNIVGTAVRTTNENGQSAQDIPTLWGKFMSENIKEKIPNRVDDTIYCMYTDYEKDYTKPYTTIIGCKVLTLENIPEGMVGKTIKTTNYVKYVAKGNIMQGSVQKVWEDIWKGDLNRAYIADFDVYDERARNLEDAEVDIFVSVQ